MKTRFCRQILATLFLAIFFTQSVFAACWDYIDGGGMSGLEAYPTKSPPHVFAYYVGELCWFWQLGKGELPPEFRGGPVLAVSLDVNRGQRGRYQEFPLTYCPEMSFISVLWEELLSPGGNHVTFEGHVIWKPYCEKDPITGEVWCELSPLQCRPFDPVFFHELDVYVPPEP